MRRILAVVLPRVRLEIAMDTDAALASGDGVVAIVVARPGGAVKDERSLLGNTRLDEVSPEAYALGVRPGHTIAAARARAATLSVRVVHEGAVTAALARLAEALLSFGATTSMSSVDGTSRAPARAWSKQDGTSRASARAWSKQDDCVWVDTTGCAHLYGGEETLARALLSRVRALGHACRVGVADGPRIAAQIAWYSREDVTLAPPGEGARALGPLPVSALPVDGETLRWLTSTGLRKIADVQALPRKGLGVRLGPNAAEVLALLGGDDRAPLTPYVPPEVPEETVDIEYGVTSTEALVFVAKRLSAMLAARLEGRGVGATRLELVLKLDRALVKEGAPVRVVAISLPVPLVREDDLLAVLRAKLESFVVPAPVLSATLRAPELAPRGAQALDLFVPEARADRALPRLVAELVAELGEGAVGRLALTNRWSPLDRAVLLPYGVRAEKSPRLASLAGAAVEPTRILPQRKPLASSPRVTITRRLEAVEWWKKGFARTDYGHAWLEAARATAWVEIVRTGEGATDPPSVALRGWVD
jgi:protein ImuB